MKRNKRWTAMTMAVVIGLASTAISTENVNAEEMPQEYVVVADNTRGYAIVETQYGDEMSEASLESEIMQDNHIAVVELTEKEAEKLENEKDILTVEEDILLSAAGISQKSGNTKPKKKTKKQQDAESEYTWNLQAINAEAAVKAAEQKTGKKQQKIKVALLDSGVDYVSGINLEGYVNYVEGEEEYSPIFQDLTGHGTGIASIIAGNGETGIHGVNPNAELYSVKIMDETNQAPLSRVIRGIYWCIENKMNIINMSFGTHVYSQALEQAVKDAYDAGILMVAAAGNGNGSVEYPAAFEEVMAVASTSPAEKSVISAIQEKKWKLQLREKRYRWQVSLMAAW